MSVSYNMISLFPFFPVFETTASGVMVEDREYSLLFTCDDTSKEFVRPLKVSIPEFVFKTETLSSEANKLPTSGSSCP